MISYLPTLPMPGPEEVLYVRLYPNRTRFADAPKPNASPDQISTPHTHPHHILNPLPHLLPPHPQPTPLTPSSTPSSPSPPSPPHRPHHPP